MKYKIIELPNTCAYCEKRKQLRYINRSHDLTMKCIITIGADLAKSAKFEVKSNIQVWIAEDEKTGILISHMIPKGNSKKLVAYSKSKSNPTIYQVVYPLTKELEKHFPTHSDITTLDVFKVGDNSIHFKIP